MKKEIKISINNNIASISFKNKTNTKALSIFKELTYNSKITKTDIANVIGLSQSNYDKVRNKVLVLFSSYSNAFIEVVPFPCNIDDNTFNASNRVLETLKLDMHTQATLLICNSFNFEKIKMQKLDSIKTDTVIMSPIDINNNLVSFTNFSLFCIRNILTNQNITIQTSHIIFDKTLPNGTILFDRKQREILGLETPDYFTPAIFNTLLNNISLESDKSEEEMSLIKSSYTETDLFLKQTLPYETKIKIKKIIDKYLHSFISIYPIIESYNLPENKKIKKISDFYVGKSTISLVCRRPYNNDEGTNIVRISPSNMKILGIEEMDKVIISHHKKSISCRVLALDNQDSFSKTNLPIDINYAIGVPAYIRKELGITNLNTAIKIDRDTTFIFKKSINEQIVPIILSLFTINVFRDTKIWISALISLISIPIVVYFNMSKKRNMRG